MEGETGGEEDRGVAGVELESGAEAEVRGEPPGEVGLEAAACGESGDRLGGFGVVLESKADEGLEGDEEFEGVAVEEEGVTEAEIGFEEEVEEGKRAAFGSSVIGEESEAEAVEKAEVQAAAALHGAEGEEFVATEEADEGEGKARIDRRFEVAVGWEV